MAGGVIFLVSSKSSSQQQQHSQSQNKGLVDLHSARHVGRLIENAAIEWGEAYVRSKYQKVITARNCATMTMGDKRERGRVGRAISWERKYEEGEAVGEEARRSTSFRSRLEKKRKIRFGEKFKKEQFIQEDLKADIFFNPSSHLLLDRTGCGGLLRRAFLSSEIALPQAHSV